MGSLSQDKQGAESEGKYLSNPPALKSHSIFRVPLHTEHSTHLFTEGGKPWCGTGRGFLAEGFPRCCSLITLSLYVKERGKRYHLKAYGARVPPVLSTVSGLPRSSQMNSTSAPHPVVRQSCLHSNCDHIPLLKRTDSK